MEIKENYESVRGFLNKESVRLIAVSKTRTPDEIMKLYDRGHRDFGENRVQELIDKKEELPDDIRWHMVGHLQRNKVKYIAPYIHMVQSLDSGRLAKELDKRAANENRVVPVLLQIHIAEEKSKYGLTFREAEGLITGEHYPNLEFRGLMGIATLTEDQEKIRNEFRSLAGFLSSLRSKDLPQLKNFKELSMGMTDDYPLAVEEGATMVRVGRLIFGERES